MKYVFSLMILSFSSNLFAFAGYDKIEIYYDNNKDHAELVADAFQSQFNLPKSFIAVYQAECVAKSKIATLCIKDNDEIDIPTEHKRMMNELMESFGAIDELFQE